MPDVKLADLANALYRAEKAYQAKRKQFDEKLAPLKEARDAIEAQMLARMLEEKQEAVSTKTATIAIKRTQFAELFDDKAFFAFVGKEKAWDLVRKQPVISACKQRWDDDVKIPGVRPGTRTDLSITTRSKG